MRDVGDFVLVGGIGAGKSLGIIIRVSEVLGWYNVLTSDGVVTMISEDTINDPPVQISKLVSLMAHWALRDITGMAKSDYLCQLTMIAEDEIVNGLIG